jgi:hypothetical protein
LPVNPISIAVKNPGWDAVPAVPPRPPLMRLTAIL